MKRRALLCLPLAPFAALAAAQGKGKAKGHEKRSAAGGGLEARFQAGEVRIIVDYFHPAGGLPPGLAKRGGDLPPGLEKQLRRKGTLPPGLQKRLTPFPPDLEARLPRVPAGCRRVRMDTWALLIADAANVILDVIDLTRR